MTEYKKQGLIYLTILLFVIFQFGMIIAHFLGADLTISVSFKVNYIEELIINLIIYISNMYLFLRISTKTDKAFLKCLIFIPIYLIMWFVFPNGVVFMAISIFYIFAIQIMLAKIKFYKFILNLFILFVFTAVLQNLSLYIKSSIIFIPQNDFVLNIIISIDYVIILYFIMKGVDNYDRFQLVLFTKRRKLRMGEKDCKQSEVDLTEKQGKIYWVLVMGTQVLQLFLLVYIGWRFGAMLELSAILIAFWAYRTFLGVSWHANTLITCTLLSIVFFVCLSIKTVPLNASITITLLAALGLAVALHMYELKCNQIERKNKALIKMSKSINPAKAIESSIRNLGLSKRHAEAEIKRKVEGKTVKQIAEEMNFSEDSIKRFFREIKKAKNK